MRGKGGLEARRIYFGKEGSRSEKKKVESFLKRSEKDGGNI
jgi:hypothetical protein